MSHKHREEIQELSDPESAVPVSEPISTENKVQQLTAALKGEEWLLRQCQRVLELYVQQKINADDTVDALLRLLDGPEQRRIQEAAREALGINPQQ